jgi:hypothetical protein
VKDTIYLSADHGNVEAKGIGNITLQDKVGNTSRSKRHISFPNEILAKNFRKKYDENIIGQLNNDLFCRHNEAFALQNQTVITHGGSHFWEILVPFIIL